MKFNQSIVVGDDILFGWKIECTGIVACYWISTIYPSCYAWIGISFWTLIGDVCVLIVDAAFLFFVVTL